MPVLHVQPVPARLRQLRVVVQELEQDDVHVVTPHPEPQHAAMSDQNRAVGLTKENKERGDFLLQEYFWRGNYFVLQFCINSEKSTPGEITDITVSNHFCKDGMFVEVESRSNVFTDNNKAVEIVMHRRLFFLTS